jgi:hypothetical protein
MDHPQGGPVHRIVRLSRTFQTLCTVAICLVGVAAVALGHQVAQSDYHSQRLLELFNANYSRLRLWCHWDLVLTANAALLLWIIPWLAGLVVCRQIFASFAAGHGFQWAMPRGCRGLAWVVWSTVPGDYLLSPSVIHTWRNLLFLLHSRALFLGLALWCFAAIMDQACRLQEEQDLVV